MKKTLLMLALSSIALAGCTKPESKNSAAPAGDAASSAAVQPASEASAPADALPAGDTAETSLDWAGKYKGVFPCADCEGIKMELELKSDKTYKLTEEYLGKGKGNEFKTEGAFSFDAKNPSVITLDQAADKRKFFIGENFAEARDIETGEAIETQLNYKLSKELN